MKRYALGLLRRELTQSHSNGAIQMIICASTVATVAWLYMYISYVHMAFWLWIMLRKQSCEGFLQFRMINGPLFCSMCFVQVCRAAVSSFNSWPAAEMSTHCMMAGVSDTCTVLLA